jgi:phi LC3 family holin
MNINWKVRLKNKAFWVSAVASLLLVIQAFLAFFGVVFDFGDFGNKIYVFINCVFGFLSALGIVNDPTTAGISDSQQAMTYEEPKK